MRPKLGRRRQGGRPRGRTTRSSGPGSNSDRIRDTARCTAIPRTDARTPTGRDSHGHCRRRSYNTTRRTSRFGSPCHSSTQLPLDRSTSRPERPRHPPSCRLDGRHRRRGPRRIGGRRNPRRCRENSRWCRIAGNRVYTRPRRPTRPRSTCRRVVVSIRGAGEKEGRARRRSSMRNRFGSRETVCVGRSRDIQCFWSEGIKRARGMQSCTGAGRRKRGRHETFGGRASNT